MGERTLDLRLSWLAAGCWLAACQPLPVPSNPPDPSPAPQHVGAAPGPALTFTVEAKELLRGRALSALKIEVDGVRAEPGPNGTWRAAVAPADRHTVRVGRQSYLTSTYQGPLVEGACLQAQLCPTGIRVVAFGDSLTAGLKVDLADRFLMKLEARLQSARPGFWVDFRDAGRSGDTYESALDRVTDDVLNANPDLTFVEFGTNDAFKTRLADFPDSVDALLAPIVQVSPRVLVADIPYKPRWYGDWNDHTAPYNRAIAEVAARNGARLVSFSQAFRKAAQGGQWDLFYHEEPYDTTKPDTVSQGDLHPNAEGNELMAETLGDAILSVTEPSIGLKQP
ncbi:MAG TPA: SGNH/GDSL hydrolase family protein [Stenomitos sp.]